jgi:hypothetical protein
VILTGPTVYGAYLDPTHALGLELDGVGHDELVDEIARNGTAVAWQREIDGRTVMVTHAGGIFVEFHKAPAADDPLAEMDAQLREAADLANLVVCDMALRCGTYASAFSVAELASAMRDADRVEAWAAPIPFAPAALEIQSQLKQRDTALAQWFRTTPERLAELADLELALTLRDISANLPAFVAAAHGHARRARGAECLLFAWMACEQLLNHHWKGQKFGTPPTSALTAAGLHAQGHLTDEQHRLITKARRQRNDLAHNAAVDPSAIEAALDALYAALDAVLGPPAST